MQHAQPSSVLAAQDKLGHARNAHQPVAAALETREPAATALLTEFEERQLDLQLRPLPDKGGGTSTHTWVSCGQTRVCLHMGLLRVRARPVREGDRSHLLQLI
jgi:hypothetical protein